MNRRLYNILFGSLLLIDLYFELNYIIYALIGIVYFEAATNIMLPKYLTKLPIAILNNDSFPSPADDPRACRFKFNADRVWKLFVGTLLFVSFVLYFQYLWFIPWFLGFAILGAGISNVCPMLEMIRFAGFKR